MERYRNDMSKKGTMALSGNKHYISGLLRSSQGRIGERSFSSGRQAARPCERSEAIQKIPFGNSIYWMVYFLTMPMTVTRGRDYFLCNSIEFDGIKNRAGSNGFSLTPKRSKRKLQRIQ
ncbi:MAG: hypothetical protein LBL42_07130 [Tannerella sp.]|jgi:hypothetical protein|nr:hypothetical protein [Tannerella sp.]